MSIFCISAILFVVAQLSILALARARVCVVHVRETISKRFSVFFSAGASGRDRRVNIECSMVALAHRRGRSGAGALWHDDTGEYPLRKWQHYRGGDDQSREGSERPRLHQQTAGGERRRPFLVFQPRPLPARDYSFLLVARVRLIQPVSTGSYRIDRHVGASSDWKSDEDIVHSSLILPPKASLTCYICHSASCT